MKDWRFWIVFIVLAVVQIILCNFLDLSRYAVLSFLPVLILMLPLKLGNVPMMLISFALGFAVDFFSTGMLGLTAASLVPVGLLRNALVLSLFGDELGPREGELTLNWFGVPKFALATLILCSVYFLVYVWIDSAGTYGFWAGALRFALSTLLSTPVCLGVARILRPE
ncbi:MAG: hypothetical protein J5533_01100 [Bacteroidales bacterium]|nr:hypothetical protein [Bacteroidales bacterium]